MTIVEFATRRRVTVGMATLTLVLFGLIALSGLKVNLLPDLSYPTLTVRTAYEGAAPAEIENLISQPVEEALGVVNNVHRIHSVSRSGVSDVILEFGWGTNMESASLEVRDKLDVLQLPLQADKPVLLRFDPSTDPVLRIDLVAADGAAGLDAASLKRLRRFADDDLKRRLEPIEGVAAVKVGGGLEDEVQVEVDQHQLARLGLSMGDVVKRLEQENVNVSAGRVEDGSQRYLVRTINQFGDLGQMGDTLLKLDGDVPVRLGDVARVTQGHKERQGIVRVDGREAVELAIYKEGDANTVAVAKGVRAALDRLKPTLPHDAELRIVDDASVFIEHALADVRVDALIGGLLAVLMIYFFLGHAWSTFIISLSLPVSLIATFFFMGEAGLSLNVMSLGGLALATGMVVDDSIVVLENIARLRDAGASVLEASIRGAREVAMAVTASTLTTVAVFFPLVFVRGVGGQLFRDQALTITFAMLISLLVAMTLIPMLASLKGRAPLAFRDEPPMPAKALPRNRVLRGARRGLGASAEALLQVLPRAMGWLLRHLARGIAFVVGMALRPIAIGVRGGYTHAAHAYHALLPKALDRPWLVLGTASLLFAGSLALLPTLGMDLIPSLAQNRFEATVKLPPGTALAETDALVGRIQRAHANDPRIASIYAVSGTGTRLDATPTESGENIARLSVTLAPDAGKHAERDVMDALRATLAADPDAEVRFSRPALFSLATPLEIELRGHDLDALATAGNKLSQLMADSTRFTDIKSTVAAGYPEIRIRFDQDRAAALGLTTRQIADVVAAKVRGDIATRYNFRDRKIDVRVRARAADRANVDDIRNLIVNPGAADPVRLSAVARIVASEGPSEIHRVDQERVALVSAGLHHGDLGSAVAEVRDLIAAHPLAAGVSAHIGGQGEELDASVRSLLFAFGLAIFLVYLVMASQFESLLHPFVILLSIPLALVGAVLALKLTGTPLSVIVFIGLIMLAGIVVKNAIVLIDRVNQLREEGHAKREALILGAESRLRPIVMTTLATLLGFLPLAIAVGDGAELRAPMAITVIGGLLVSTLLTLIVIPVVYERLDRKADAAYRQRGERRGRNSDATTAAAPIRADVADVADEQGAPA